MFENVYHHYECFFEILLIKVHVWYFVVLLWLFLKLKYSKNNHFACLKLMVVNLHVYTKISTVDSCVYYDINKTKIIKKKIYIQKPLETSAENMNLYASSSDNSSDSGTNSSDSGTCKVNEIQNKHSIWHVHISKTIKVTLRNIKHALWSIKIQKNIHSDDNHFQTCELTTFISKTYKLTNLISQTYKLTHFKNIHTN